MATNDELIETLLRHGCELHFSFDPKEKCRDGNDHYHVTEWNKYVQAHGHTLNEVLAKLHDALIGVPPMSEELIAGMKRAQIERMAEASLKEQIGPIEHAMQSGALEQAGITPFPHKAVPDGFLKGLFESENKEE